ncbi:unnamed protein product [Effrenium voratum]|nr:unnamed protein product [Effrenium voratum]|mmetsp:Transcript_69560/g.165913  ORF Transcript_69560/g.165913 Transcript_69560/m.165913 type:complete len:347 (+) Transcript_69560:56-1096(+)
MSIVYDISVRNTFLQFKMPEEPIRMERAFTSPATLVYKEVCKSKCSDEYDAEDTCSTVASAEEDVFSVDGLSKQSTPVTLGCSRPSLAHQIAARASAAENLAAQKRINRALCASKAASKVLEVVDRHLEDMSGINLATAFHRLAKGKGPHIARTRTFQAMITAAMRKAEQGLRRRDGTLPENCCTIIAWCCASLGEFQGPLFSLLAKVAQQNLASCQAYEVTNLLWACARLQKLRPDVAIGLSQELEGLLDAAATYFRHRDDIKAQVLVSGLVSLANFAEAQNQSQGWLFAHLSEQLASKFQDLSMEHRTQVSLAFQLMKAKNSSLALQVARSVAIKSPELSCCVF